VLDLRMGATFLPRHNRDAPEIVPRRVRLHVWSFVTPHADLATRF
jgi:hypothetical protein